jgi:hypothetical protein
VSFKIANRQAGTFYNFDKKIWGTREQATEFPGRSFKSNYPWYQEYVDLSNLYGIQPLLICDDQTFDNVKESLRICDILWKKGLRIREYLELAEFYIQEPNYSHIVKCPQILNDSDFLKESRKKYNNLLTPDMLDLCLKEAAEIQKTWNQAFIEEYLKKNIDVKEIPSESIMGRYLAINNKDCLILKLTRDDLTSIPKLIKFAEKNNVTLEQIRTTLYGK